MSAVGFPSPPSKLCGRRPASPPSNLTARHLAFGFRSSADAAAPDTSSAAAEADATAPPASSESPVETQKREPSLISAANVQKALRGVAITTADHYGRLGINRSTPYDQVRSAYNKKCEELMYRGLEEEGISKELELLKESYGILSSDEERRLYDWSLARSENPDRYVWPFQVDLTQTPTEFPPPQEPEDEGPTKLVGYFFLGWFILSIILSVTLNR